MTNARTIAAVAAAGATLFGLLAVARTPKPVIPTPEEAALAAAAEEKRQKEAARAAAAAELAQRIAAIEKRQALSDARAHRYFIAGWVSIALPFAGWGIAGLIFVFSLAPLVVITAAPIVLGAGLHIAAATIARKGRKRFAHEFAELNLAAN